MNLYAFELGRKKELCFQELISILGEKNLHERNLDTAIFKLELKESQKLQDSLGGTIKIIEIIEALPKSKNPDYPRIEQTISDYLNRSFKDHSGKIPFAVSLLSYKNPEEINIKGLLNFSKKILKSLGLNSRFVNKNFRSTRPSTIYKAKVVEKGVDINIIKGENNIYIGHTITIQNIDAYSKRDFDKPKRDARVGMTPPKLAQIMINLAGKETKTIYDPFCGTGTYLMEALLMDKNAIGSDISDRMVEYTEENIEWLKTTFRINSELKNQTFIRDARFITKEILPEKIDAIVTEGYLGTPQTALPKPHEQEVIFRELANLHLNWLNAINKISNAKIVMCVAAFKDKDKIIHLPKFQQIAETSGYRITLSFTYDRPDQIVARDIYVLFKK